MRRRRPSASRAGTGCPNASRISPRAHPLAEADEASVLGVGCDRSGVRVGASAGLGEVGHGDGREVGAWLQREPGGVQVRDHLLGQCKGGGHSGRADPADPHVPVVRAHVIAVVAMLGGGAQAGIGRGDLMSQQVGHDPTTRVEQSVEPGARSARCASVGHVVGRGTEQHIAVRRG